MSTVHTVPTDYATLAAALAHADVKMEIPFNYTTHTL